MSNQSENPSSISGLCNPPRFDSELHLGVTGHRDIVDHEEAKQAVVDALDEIDRICSPSSIILHNPLAEGADRLVLEACEQWGGSDGNPPVSVRIVLPLSEDEYKENYKGDRTWLDEQLDKFKGVPKILRDPYVATPYERLAVHFRENCDLVLALWDGIDNGKPGGTADVVDNVLANSRRENFPAVLWISVARKSNPFPTAEKFSRRTLYPQQEYAALIPEKSWIQYAQSALRWALGISGSIAVLCGVAGYSEHGDERFSEALVISLTHLVGGSYAFSGEEEYHGLVILGWWAAVVFFVISAGFILNTAFHLVKRIHRWRNANRTHDLIFGLGERGRNLLYASHLLEEPVIAVDIDPDAQAKEICEKTNIPLVIGDSFAPKTIKKLGIAKGRRAFVCTGTDLVNTRIVHRLAETYPRTDPDSRLKCAVGLKSTENFDTLRQALPDHGLDLRIFNREAVTARALLRNVHLDRFAGLPTAKGASILIAGTSPMADEILRQVIQIGHFEDGKKLRVARLCKDAESEVKKFVDHYPCFTSLEGGQGCPVATPDNVWFENEVLPKVEFHELPASSRGRSEWAEKNLDTEGWITTVFVCDTEPMDSARLAEDLAPPLERLRSGHGRDIALWFYFRGAHEQLRFDLERNLDRQFNYLHVESFTDFMGRCDHACAMGQLSDEVARRINGFYWGIPLEERDEIEKVWSGISEHDKDSSRQAAEHAWVKLRVRRRLRGRSPGGEGSVTEELARIEHRRWCAELLMKGFLPLTRIPQEVSGWTGPNPEEADLCKRWFAKDKELKKASKIAKRHIDLVPFDDLISLLGEERGASEQQKDHSQVEALDDLLGLEVEQKDEQPLPS